MVSTARAHSTARRGESPACPRGNPRATARAPERRSERGLSLVEVVFAGFVLTIAGVGLAATLAQAGPMNESPREDYAAWNAIRTMRARLISVPFPEAALDFHQHGFAVPGLRPLKGDPDGMPGEIVFNYGPEEDTRFYRVTLRVRWTGVRGARELEAQVYLANVRGDVGTVPLLSNLAPPVTEVDPVIESLLDPEPVLQDPKTLLSELAK